MMTTGSDPQVCGRGWSGVLGCCGGKLAAADPPPSVYPIRTNRCNTRRTAPMVTSVNMVSVLPIRHSVSYLLLSEVLGLALRHPYGCIRATIARIAARAGDPNRAPVEGAQCPLCGELERHRIDCPDNLEHVDPEPDYDAPDPDPDEATPADYEHGHREPFARLRRFSRGLQRRGDLGRPGWRPSDYP